MTPRRSQWLYFHRIEVVLGISSQVLGWILQDCCQLLMRRWYLETFLDSLSMFIGALFQNRVLDD